MRNFASSVVYACTGMVLAGCASWAQSDAAPSPWPPESQVTRPWAFNWWMGSAVDKENLARELRQYRDGGLGGIHIIPIYGAKGAESRYIDFLSPKWMEMMSFTVKEARGLGLGVDMTTGTGWCFGGPMITPELGGQAVTTTIIPVAAGGHLKRTFKHGAPAALRAVAADGTTLNLLPKVKKDGKLDWTADGKTWTLYALETHFSGMKVKRAAPGGAGPMLNPFSAQSMRRYLEPFTQAFAAPGVERPRAMYHDSYEYYGAQWAPELPAEFAARRGYRLEDELAAFAGKGEPDRVARVQADYRETVSDLMVERFFPQWIAWNHEHGCLTRYQAHGSPGNWLDLYALADIPETEMFGRGTRDPLRSGFDARFGEGDRNPLVSKFASSAAHTAGRQLVSAETGTWMAEHFCETLEEMKCFVDRMFVSGINHVFYHGCVYSPDDAAWPGWLFYAATEMNPRNAIWHDVPALNAYISRCQAVLQSGRPDNEVLLYWPIHDRWHKDGPMPEPFTVHKREWLTEEPVGAAAARLWTRGYGFDYVSDRQLRSARVNDSEITLAAARYRVIVVPSATLMPPETLRSLVELARHGAAILFVDHLPKDVPGFGRLEERRVEFARLVKELALEPAGDGVSLAKIGLGTVLTGGLEPMLARAGVCREALVDHAGAMFIRRRTENNGRYYFIANQGAEPIQGWFTLAHAAAAVQVMDPMTGRIGAGQMRTAADGAATELFLRLEAGHSIILRTFADSAVSGPVWNWSVPGGALQEVRGPWQVNFLEGGPVLPKPYTTAVTGSWTANGDPETARFAGTARYSTEFALAPDAVAAKQPLLLDLGHVCHSARVTLNGQQLGTLFMSPYRLTVPVGLLKASGNRLEVEVTNLSANRIRDLDKRKVQWKIFREINLVNIDYKPFDASDWPLFDSGLLGPVTLQSVVTEAATINR